MRFQSDLKNIRSRALAFWNQDCLDRPMAAFPVRENGVAYRPNDYPQQVLSDDAMAQFFCDPSAVQRRMLEKFEKTAFIGDALPVIMPNYGPAGHAGAFGAKPAFRRDSIWYEPCLADCETVVYNPDAPIKRVQDAMVRYLHDKNEGRYFISMPDNCGSIDALAALRGPENLMMDFVEEPEWVEASVNTIIDGLFDINDPYFDLVKSDDADGCVHAWMHLWAPGRLAQMQCDFSAMISPAMYERFAVPELIKTSQRLDYAVYHLDGMEQVRHLDLILAVDGIDAIQWTPVAGQPRTSAFIDVFHTIQDAGKSLVLLPEPDEIEPLCRALRSEGLMLVCNSFPTEAAARDILRKLPQWSAQSR